MGKIIKQVKLNKWNNLVGDEAVSVDQRLEAEIPSVTTVAYGVIVCPFCYTRHSEKDFWVDMLHRSEISSEGFYCRECEQYFEVGTTFERMLYICDGLVDRDTTEPTNSNNKEK